MELMRKGFLKVDEQNNYLFSDEILITPPQILWTFTQALSVYVDCLEQINIYKAQNLNKVMLHILERLYRYENFFWFARNLEELKSKLRIYEISSEEPVGMEYSDWKSINNYVASFELMINLDKVFDLAGDCSQKLKFKLGEDNWIELKFIYLSILEDCKEKTENGENIASWEMEEIEDYNICSLFN